MPQHPTARRALGYEVLAVAVLLAIAVLVHRGSMGQPLVEEHAFRQTQTAITAVDFKAHGIDLFHPRLPVFGPGSQVPFEFPLFQAIATIPMNMGIAADEAMRITGLACFLLTAILLFGLIRRVGGRVAGFGALVAFLFSPFGLLWSRTSMIEYLATAGALGFVWAGIEWRDRREWYWAVLAIVVGSLAMMVKITTGVFWILPLVLYTAAKEAPGIRAWVRERLKPGLIAVVAVPLLAGYLWTRHTDTIKEANAATRWLTSASLKTWNFGTLHDRVVAANWTTIFDRMESLLVGRYLWAGLALIALWVFRRQGFWLGLLLVIVLAPTVFFNLYVVHDYYIAAISPAVAGLLGLVAAWLWSHRPSSIPWWAFAGGLAVLWSVWIIWPAWGYVSPMYHAVTNPSVQAADEIRALVPPGAPLLVQGGTWDPTTLYYSGHEGFMLDARAALPDVVRKFPDQGYHYLFSYDPATLPIELVSEWPWVGVLGPRTYVVGRTAASVGRAPVVARTTPGASTTGRGPSQTLACDGSRLPIASGSRVHIDLQSADVAGLRLWVRDDLAPLPWVSTIATSGGGSLHCTGPPSITVSIAAGN